MAESYRKKAERGAALLDRLMPSWFKLIDLDTLKLEDCQNCICGQIARKSGVKAIRQQRRFRSWIDWSVSLTWLANRLHRDSFDELHEHGFVADSERGYHLLDKEWGKLVTERLAKS